MWIKLLRKFILAKLGGHQSGSRGHRITEKLKGGGRQQKRVGTMNNNREQENVLIVTKIPSLSTIPVPLVKEVEVLRI